MADVPIANGAVDGDTVKDGVALTLIVVLAVIEMDALMLDVGVVPRLDEGLTAVVGVDVADRF